MRPLLDLLELNLGGDVCRGTPWLYILGRELSRIAGKSPIGRLAGSQAGGSVRYHSEVDLSDTEATSTQLVLLTGRDKKVLEVGPATGYITRVLRERGCKVTCIEVDRDAAKLAAPWSERTIVGDVERLDFGEILPGERFDVVLLGDVLEHLVDPGDLLARCGDLLKGGGYVVASIPNVAHGSVRLALLAGRFPYTEWGLLDRTHLRFFDKESLETLFDQAGYAIREWRRKTNDPFDTELELLEEDFPAHLVQAVRSAPEALTYQFIVRAEPLGPGGPSAEISGHASLGSGAVRASLGHLFRLEERARKRRAAILARRARDVVRTEGWGPFFLRLLRPWRWLPRLLKPPR
jgi:2-polyprenyl-3-methyl-5-hydroxy-6-metoxy-1,4-benzoquinol methylase